MFLHRARYSLVLFRLAGRSKIPRYSRASRRTGPKLRAFARLFHSGPAAYPQSRKRKYQLSHQDLLHTNSQARGAISRGYSQGRACHGDVEPICNHGRPTSIARPEERCHAQPHGSNAGGVVDQQRQIIAAAFQGLLFDRNCRRDARLVVSLRLDQRKGGAVAASLGMR